jgi:hypothetical protein
LLFLYEKTAALSARRICHLVFYMVFPKNAFQRRLFALRFRPAFVVGIPVAFAIFRFAPLIPTARFHEKPGIIDFRFAIVKPPILCFFSL